MGPAFGALGATFKVSRALQVVCMVAVIGITANFISEMVSANATPPPVLVGTLSVVCTAVLYCAITVILYLDSILPFLINTVIDCLFLIALVVVAVVAGKPVSYVNCKALGELSNATSSAYDFTTALGSSLSNNGGKVQYSDWVGTSTSTCLEIKSVWGLSIALCILFTLSAISSLCLWKRTKGGAPSKSEV